MLNFMKVKGLYESRCAQSNGRWRFVNELRENLGLCDGKGNDYRDSAGNKKLGNRSLTAEQFSVRELAEAIIGPSWRVIFDDSNKSQFSRLSIARSLVEQGNPGDTRALLESTGVGLDPTAFLNINAFSAVVGGLIEVKILEAFQNPDFIGDILAPAESTKLNGQKMIGVQSIGDSAKKRAVGDPHPRVQFGERWVQTPETRENALAIDVDKETVFFDRTGDILSMANTVGEAIAYRKELEILSVVIGGTNNFIYNGTAYNTYQTSRTLGYLNQVSNELIDWESVQTAKMYFQRTADPHTGKRILIRPDTVLVNPAKEQTANIIFGSTSMGRRTGQGASTPQTTSNPLHVAEGARAPYSGEFKVLTSPLLEQMCLDTAANGGLALSQANTDKYWWMMQAGKAFKYMQNWPLSVTQAAPNQYEMIDKGLISSYFANERGIAAVVSPWHVFNGTN